MRSSVKTVPKPPSAFILRRVLVPSAVWLGVGVLGFSGIWGLGQGFSYSEFDRYAAHHGNITSLAFLEGKSVLASGGQDGSLLLRDLAGKRDRIRLVGHRGAVACLTSWKGRYLASGDGKGTVILRDLETGRSDTIDGHSKVLAVAFNPDGDVLASSGEDRRIKLWSVPGGRQVGEFRQEAPADHLLFRSGTSLMAVGRDRRVDEIDIAAKRVVRNWEDDSLSIDSVVLGREGDWLALSSQQTASRKGSSHLSSGIPRPTRLIRRTEIRVYDLETGRLVKGISLGEVLAKSLSVSADDELFAIVQKNITRTEVAVWQRRSGEQSALLQQPTRDKATVVRFGPSGRYLAVGNEKGEVTVWKTEGIAEPAEFLIAGRTPDETGRPGRPAVDAKPEISITYPADEEVTSEARIVLRGVINDPGGLRSVSLRLNDQAAGRSLELQAEGAPQARGSEVELKGTPKSYSLDYAVELLPGRNVITVGAVNSNGLSDRVSRVVFFETPLNAASRVKNRWAFIVGISSYGDEKVRDLKYAHRDAEDLYNFLQTPAGGGYRQENMVLLTNELATSQAVRTRMIDFVTKPDRDDLVLFYFSAHGTPDPDRPDSVYLVTSDTELVRQDGSLSFKRSTAVSVRELELHMENLRAQRVIVLADTCHSAAFRRLDTRDLTPPAEAINNAFNAALSKSKPSAFIFTSSLGDELSQEGEQWGGGHGVFTHYLLEALKGAADANGDGVVVAEEVAEYVREKVKNDTGNRQHPTNLSLKNTGLPMGIAGKRR